ncbi:membrane carboxypeptidase (penicillin-binding protein) [Synechococcus sp. PCC 7502]|uniref:transglycosylase domain-containing protein n=1 Tax=Synechococcus sp. PCC 7502 TaxID=1173263 RepID=UPI00029FFD80|nr:transglycosylase domain-containing protein [Synechococcus sp. PCC 7502]AFY74321.1 membrane carboxypeptidase (penicillin-binding protein) [Synechococcus sp. PCC 7502]
MQPLNSRVLTLQAQVAGRLKAKAKVPRLEIFKSGQKRPEVYDLVGDRYVLGRSSGKCQIVIQTPVVSQVHAEITRRNANNFVISDQDSTNGIYRGHQRLKSITLKHKMVITLGPPELEAAVTVRYIDPPPWYIRTLQYTGFGILGLSTLLILAIAIEWQKFSVKPLPIAQQGQIEVLAGDKTTSIAPPDREKHTEIGNLSEFGTYLPNAVIASEDNAYYYHLGVNPGGILRALVTNVSSGELRQGGSTITQQLARLLLGQTYVGTSDSAGRKWREAVAAIKLTFTYSKNDLLTIYLNRVYLGNGVYGFQDAARLYFNKSLPELDLSEAATLAGILPAPNLINPFKNKKLALEYRDRILNRMAELGMVKPEVAERARRSILKLNLDAQGKVQGTVAPYYYGYVYDELENIAPNLAREGNFVIETSLDIAMQKAADQSLRQAVATQGAAYNFSQGAIVTMDASNGSILTMTGGVDFQKSQFNRATNAYRQPGSTFKLFTYLAAIAQGIPPTTTFSCSPRSGVAGCHNGGSGFIDMYHGFALSENVIAIQVADAAGLGNVLQTARKLGITSKLEENYNLVLGGYEVKMLEMVGAYGTIANLGIYNTPHAIQRIYDTNSCSDRKNYTSCELIFDANTYYQPSPRIDPNIADTMIDLMAGVVNYGTARGASLAQATTVGKTGTTDQGRDLWFIGFAPSSKLLAAVWLGNDEGITDSSSVLAVQVWSNYMAKVIR